jgi:uncharacterized phage protein gp47/JayE
MAFADNNSSTDILNRILANLPSNVDSSEGSFLYDAVSPVANELASLYADLDTFLGDVFAQTATGTYLDNRAGEFGVTRNQGTESTGQITFTGTNGTVINQGTIVQTTSGLQYTTNASATIANGAATVNITASAIGSSYNVPANIITTLPVQINGITSVTNPSALETGTDTETDAAFLKRFLAFVQTPATSGNVSHYIQWAQQVTGIGAVQVYPLWNGAGTVKVCAIDVNSNPLGSTLLANLQTYIESQRPIGATVTYETATALPINIVVQLTLANGYTDAQIQSAITTAITSYLQGIAFNQTTVSYAKIGSIILGVAGVADYSNLTLNSGTVNITIPQEQVATMGTLTITN